LTNAVLKYFRVPWNGVIRDTFCFISNLNCMMLFNQINYVVYWKRILECSKNMLQKLFLEKLIDLLVFRITAIKHEILNFFRTFWCCHVWN
jgi:hypothetical protein